MSARLSSGTRHLILLFVLAAPMSAWADTSYLNLISLCNGSSTATGYVNWVVVQGFGMGVTNTVNTSGGGAGKPTLAPLKILKGIDSCTPQIFYNAVTGNHLANVTLVTVDSNGNVTMQITMTVVYITSINSNFASGGSVQEIVGLTAAGNTCVTTYNSNGTPTQHCWNATSDIGSGVQPSKK